MGLEGDFLGEEVGEQSGEPEGNFHAQLVERLGTDMSLGDFCSNGTRWTGDLPGCDHDSCTLVCMFLFCVLFRQSFTHSLGWPETGCADLKLAALKLKDLLASVSWAQD